jgi:hypothetical protein
MTSDFKVEAVASYDGHHDTKSAVIHDNVFEHSQTVRSVARNHPTLVWWAFFFSVSAIGW